jgi:hypothetical protein
VLTSVASTALTGVDEAEAGVASALLNASEQVSAAGGIALLSTIAATATTSYVPTHGDAPTSVAAATVHGYTIGFLVSAGLRTVAALVTIGLIRGTRPRSPVARPPALSARRRRGTGDPGR